MLSKPIRFETAPAYRSPDAKDMLVSALHRAIAQGSEREVVALVTRTARERQQVGKENAGDLFKHACTVGSSLQIKKALTTLPGFKVDCVAADGSKPLSAAIHAADSGLVRHLLQMGADPREPRRDLVPTKEIGELLTAAITINALISKRARSGRTATLPTPLEQALCEYDLTQAKALLDEERTRHSDRSNVALWTRAAHEKRSDIHCAMLVLCDSASIEELASPRRPAGRNLLEHAMRIGHPALRAWLKQVPHFPHRFSPPRDLNRKATFPGTDVPIECRHLALFWLRQRALKGKNDYSALQTADSIAQHVGIELNTTAAMLSNIAPEIHLFDNRQWGRFLVNQFNAMQASAIPGEKGVQRQICLNSLTHTLGANLSIKFRPDGTKQFAVSMYDPNLTNVHKRAATGDLAVVNQWRFASFLASPAHEAAYYPEEEKLSSAFVLSGDHLDAPPPFGTPRRLSSDMPPVTPTVLHYLLTENLAGELVARQEEICAAVEGLDEPAGIDLLAARDGLGMPALHAALNYGNAAAIAAYGDLLDTFEIPPHVLTDLLAAKDQRGVPGLHMAMQEGHTAAVSAFGSIADRSGLLPEQVIALLHCRNADGFTGLFKAMRQSHVETVKAFGRVVKGSGLPAPMQAEVLAATDRDGLPALHLAMEDKQIAAMHAFGDLVGQSGLPAQLKLELLLARNPWGQPALAQVDAVPEVIEAFQAMVHKAGLSDEDIGQLEDIQEAFRFAGGQGPQPAGDVWRADAALAHDLLADGRANELRMREAHITGFLKGLTRQEAETWLDARDSRGRPALHTALERGDADAVVVFGDILHELHGLTPRQVAGLLMAEDASGTPGLHAALANGHADAVVAFGATLRELDLPRPYKMVLLLAANGTDVPGVVAASEAGDDATIRAFYHILDDAGLLQQDVEELERIIDGHHSGQ